MKKYDSQFLYLPKTGAIQTKELKRTLYHPRHIHMHDHVEMLFITTDAECEVISNGETRRVRGPVLVIHRSGTYHGTDTLSTGPDGYASFVIFFKKKLLRELPERFAHYKTLLSDDCVIIPLTLERLAKYLPYFELMKSEADHTDRMLFLLLLVLDIAAEDAKKESVRLNAHNGYISEVLKYLVDNYDKKLLTSELAQKYQVSVSKLNSDFRRVTDLTIKQFSIRLRISHAADMLINRNATISEVSYACGFSSESYFIQAFRKYTGKTPKQFTESDTKTPSQPG